MQKLLWYPDTCECVLEYSGPNNASSFVQVVKSCSAHVLLTGVVHHEAVLAENQGKNRAVNLAATIAGVLPSDTQQIDWEFTAARDLVLVLGPIAAVHRRAISEAVSPSTRIRVR